MKLKKNNIWIFFIILISCVEPFEIENISTKNYLVINAVITNEFKHHTIELSKTINIDSTGVKPEKKAKVIITDNQQNTYNFEEIEEGKYQSIDKFKVQLNNSYVLRIETINGKHYSSSSEELTSIASIDNISKRTEKNDKGEFEVKISLNSSNLENNSNYFRYDYKETFKITSPYWNTFKIRVISDTYPYKFDLVTKTIDRYCYRTQYSNKIILTETETLSENNVKELLIRSIPISDSALSIRYSILIKQYSLNENTYNYYKLLDKFSDSDNIFSQTQVGSIPSNIKNENANEKVIGFFEVTSVSSKRIFFNRKEITNIHINQTRPDECDIFLQPKIEDKNKNSPLLEILNSGKFVFHGVPDDVPPPLNKPYLLTKKTCGDCTHLGTSYKPDFWVD